METEREVPSTVNLLAGLLAEGFLGDEARR
jgi:hypothetical protein